MSSHNNPPRLRALLVTLLSFTLFIGTSVPAFAQHTAAEVTDRLQGLDAQMEKVLKDWNAPGIGIGIVVNDKLVFAKGYGYRDY